MWEAMNLKSLKKHYFCSCGSGLNLLVVELTFPRKKNLGCVSFTATGLEKTYFPIKEPTFSNMKLLKFYLVYLGPTYKHIYTFYLYT